MYSKNRFSQASLLLSTKYFQNKIFCLELWYSVEMYALQYCSRCSRSANGMHREQRTVQCEVFPHGIMILPYSTGVSFSRLELQRLLFSFQNYLFGIYDWGLVNPFWDHVIQILIWLSLYFPNCQKLKSFVYANIYSLKSNTYFRGTATYV
jgi:hypothetical protein